MRDEIILINRLYRRRASWYRRLYLYLRPPKALLYAAGAGLGLLALLASLLFAALGGRWL